MKLSQINLRNIALYINIYIYIGFHMTPQHMVYMFLNRDNKKKG